MGASSGYQTSRQRWQSHEIHRCSWSCGVRRCVVDEDPKWLYGTPTTQVELDLLAQWVEWMLRDRTLHLINKCAGWPNWQLSSHSIGSLRLQRPIVWIYRPSSCDVFCLWTSKALESTSRLPLHELLTGICLPDNQTKSQKLYAWVISLEIHKRKIGQ